MGAIELNIQTLIIILSLILGTQIAVLFIQYKVNKSYLGIGYWLTGSTLMALGYILLIMVKVESLHLLARVANPILVLGHIFLYIGIKKYLHIKINKYIPISIFLVFNLYYYYYMFINNDVYSRTVVVTGAIALISFMIAYQLFFKRHKLISSSANFTAIIFSIYGLFNALRVFLVSSVPSIHSYEYQVPILVAGFVISIVISNLWTFGLIVMINQSLNIENQLEKEKFQLIFNTNLDAQYITRLEDGFVVDVNRGFSILSGYSRDEVLGTYRKDINIWKYSKDRKSFLKELNDKGICENIEFVFKRKDNTEFIGLISSKILMIHQVPHIITVIYNITERKKFEEALIESEEKYRSILNASPDNITITDLEGNILMMSPAAKKMFGYNLDFDKFKGMDIFEFITYEDIEIAKSNLKKMYEGGKRIPNEYHAVHRDKSLFNIEVNSEFIYNAKGQPTKMVFIIRDITERKMNELKIQELVKQLEIEKNIAQLNSITDGLTGLHNRGYFDQVLSSEFKRLKRSGAELSIIMLDIDYFKKFNDSYGHLAGDHCLQSISNTLKNSVGRPQDIVARYGGEEFIIILPETDENGAKILAERIRKAIQDLCIPHMASENSKHVTVSVGIITVYPSKLESPDQVLKLVDEALYYAKEKGRNCCVYNSNGNFKRL